MRQRSNGLLLPNLRNNPRRLRPGVQIQVRRRYQHNCVKKRTPFNGYFPDTTFSLKSPFLHTNRFINTQIPRARETNDERKAFAASTAAF